MKSEKERNVCGFCEMKKKKKEKKKRKKKEELNEILIQSYNFKSYNIGYTKKLIRYVI